MRLPAHQGEPLLDLERLLLKEKNIFNFPLYTFFPNQEQVESSQAAVDRRQDVCSTKPFESLIARRRERPKGKKKHKQFVKAIRTSISPPVFVLSWRSRLIDDSSTSVFIAKGPVLSESRRISEVVNSNGFPKRRFSVTFVSAIGFKNTSAARETAIWNT